MHSAARYLCVDLFAWYLGIYILSGSELGAGETHHGPPSSCLWSSLRPGNLLIRLQIVPRPGSRLSERHHLLGQLRTLGVNKNIRQLEQFWLSLNWNRNRNRNMQGNYFNNISWVKHRNSSLKFIQQAKIWTLLMDQVRRLCYIHYVKCRVENCGHFWGLFSSLQMLKMA